MNYRLKHIYTIAIAIVLASCGGTKEITQTEGPRPEWTQTRPNNPFFYTGIGVSAVQPDGSHLQRAKNAALSDLTSEISVEVNSTSLLYQMEQNRRFREEFRAQTELNSLETIDGYELVDSYQSGGYYWIQYRLDKSVYASERAARKKTAVDKALGHYGLAADARNERRIQAALTHAFNALGELKLYLNEPIQAEGIDGDFGIRLYAFIHEIMEDVKIKPLTDRIHLVRYQSVSPTIAAFETTTDEGLPLANIPVYLYYTGGFLRENQVKSNASGHINITMPRATQAGEMERLEADVNFVALAESATRDPLLRMLLTRHPGDRAEVPVSVRPPLVFIESDEKLGGHLLDNPPIEQALRRFLLDNNFNTTAYKDYADMVVEIRAAANSFGTRNEMHLSRLSGEILVRDNEGLLMGSLPLTSYQGVQLSEELAGQDAYRRAVRELEDHEFRKLLIQ